MMNITTEFRTDQAAGHGFYNFVSINQTNLHGDMVYGPYPSRPIARREAATLMVDMKEEHLADA